MASATENRFVNLYINGKQVGQTYQEIRRNANKLRQEIERGKLSQDEYNKKVGELRKYNAILKDHGDKIKGVNKNWGMLKSVMMGVVGGNIILGAFQKITQFIPNLINQNAKLADSFADVRKTTGLTEFGVESLSKRLKSFDTRTPRSELLGLAREAGKLGIEGLASIVGFVKAADQIQVSLGEDLGDGAITQLGKLNNLFKVSEIYGFEQGMLKLGSVINELGASSEASEGAIVDFLNRTNAAAIQAGVSYQDLAGIGATLNSLGQQAETSGTAISQVFIKMGQDTEEFAKIAGVSTAEFSKLLKEDANEALLLFLTGINGNNQGLEVFAKKFATLGLDGARAISIIGSLSGNIGKLREQQLLSNKAFEEGTSLTDEFNIKNNNAAGNLEKIGRALNALWVNSSLLKVIDNVTSALADMLKIPVSATLEQQRLEFNGLMGAIMDTTTAEEDRLSIIERLQESYGDRLGSMDLEKASLTDLQGLLAKVNNEYLIEIMLMSQRERIADLIKRQGTSMGARSENAVKANRQVTLSNEKLGTSYGTLEEAINELEKTAIEKYDRDLKRTVQLNQEAVELKKLREARGSVSIQEAQAVKASRELQVEKQNELDLIAQLKKDYPELAVIMDRMNGSTPATAPDQPTAENNVSATPAGVPNEKDLDKAAQHYEKLLGLIRKEEEKLALAKLEGRAKEEEEVRLHYEKLREEAKGHTVEIAKINELEKEALRQIDQKYGSDYDNERREVQQAIALALKSETDKKIQAENEYWEELIKQAKEKGLEYEELVIAQDKAITKIREEGSEDRKKTSIEEFLVSSQAYLEGSAVIVGAIRDIADIQGKNAKFQANIAMFQQFVNAGLALSNAAASAKGITPVDYLAGLAMVTVAIIARINQAKQMRDQAGEVPPTAFAQGTL